MTPSQITNAIKGKIQTDYNNAGGDYDYVAFNDYNSGLETSFIYNVSGGSSDSAKWIGVEENFNFFGSNVSGLNYIIIRSGLLLSTIPTEAAIFPVFFVGCQAQTLIIIF